MQCAGWINIFHLSQESKHGVNHEFSLPVNYNLCLLVNVHGHTKSITAKDEYKILSLSEANDMNTKNMLKSRTHQQWCQHSWIQFKLWWLSKVKFHDELPNMPTNTQAIVEASVG